jgi:histidinol-phosphate phosphatase family protein
LTPRPRFDVVVPSTARPSLRPLLAAVLVQGLPGRVIVVDDRRSGLDVPNGVEVVPGRGAGPAAARNSGWRAASAEWVAFLDDDVEPPANWAEALERDLARAAADVAGVQGRIEVPLPRDRRPTDWERNVAGLAGARWATADMAFRREALEAVGGFDERFPRAYREDADLALRLMDAGWRLERGERRVVHPVREADPWVSVRLQAGNRDDVLMWRLHGRRWRERAGAPAGRKSRHAATALAAMAAAGSQVAGRRSQAVAFGLAWLAGTAELAWARIAPGPKTAREVATMLATSAAMPFVATYHLAAGALTSAIRNPRPAIPDAVLLDRDGTLIHDVPYNGDPAAVRPMPGAREALDRLRRAGVPLAVVSNQSGVARGLVTREQVEAVNRRVEELLGPIGPWVYCEHGPDDSCECRKPRPGLVLRAAELLGVAPERCALVGDIGADVEAAQAAGARGVLVPTPITRPEEVARADETAASLPEAVDRLIGARA